MIDDIFLRAILIDYRTLADRKKRTMPPSSSIDILDDETGYCDSCKKITKLLKRADTYLPYYVCEPCALSIEKQKTIAALKGFPPIPNEALHVEMQAKARVLQYYKPITLPK